MACIKLRPRAGRSQRGRVDTEFDVICGDYTVHTRISAAHRVHGVCFACVCVPLPAQGRIIPACTHDNTMGIPWEYPAGVRVQGLIKGSGIGGHYWALLVR